MNERVGVMVNPASGKRRGAAVGAALMDHLRAAGRDVIDLSAPTANAAVARARAALPDIDVLAVCGGDGMAHLGVNVVAGTSTPLALVAAGTGNDIAQGLGLPLHDPLAASRVITSGTPRAIDAIRCEERWFVGVLAAGFDAVVNERANGWARPKGQLRYTLAVLRELPVFTPIHYEIEIDGTRHDTDAMLVAVGNGASYGGGMRVVPGARVDDGIADVLVLHQLSKREFLTVFPKVFSGTHVTHPAVEIIRGRQVRLAASRIVTYADGERFLPLPLTAVVVPGAVRVLT